MMSPQMPPILGGSICERSRSQRSSAVQIEQLPGQVQAGGAQDPQPNGPDQQTQAQAQQQNAREPREREGPHRCHGLSSLRL